MESEELIMIVMTGAGPNARRVRIVKGHEYIINPLNPKDMKNRGRHVIAVKAELYTPRHDNADYVLRATYLDNRKSGRVDMSVLESVDPADNLPVDR